jgi:copper resistance protein C
MTRAFTTALVAPLAFACAATAALAHAQLEKATPPVGGTVAPPSEIRLEFSEGVEPRFSGISLAGPAGASASIGKPKAEGADKRTLVVPITIALQAGVYTVHWHAVSVDTHHTQGTFQFTVKP